MSESDQVETKTKERVQSEADQVMAELGESKPFVLRSDYYNDVLRAVALRRVRAREADAAEPGLEAALEAIRHEVQSGEKGAARFTKEVREVILSNPELLDRARALYLEGEPTFSSRQRKAVFELFFGTGSPLAGPDTEPTALEGALDDVAYANLSLRVVESLARTGDVPEDVKGQITPVDLVRMLSAHFLAAAVDAGVLPEPPRMPKFDLSFLSEKPSVVEEK